MRTRTIRYVVQDNYDDKGWENHATNIKTMSEARMLLEERLRNEIWLHGGRRKWRIVRRVTSDTELK